MAITSEIADLIQRGGQIQGAGEAAKGQIWGNFLTNLAGVPAQIQRAKTERQEQQVKQMELTERQRALGEQAQLRGILAKYGGDWEKAAAEVSSVSPSLGLELQGKIQTANRYKREAQTADLEQAQKRLELYGQIFGGVENEDSYQDAKVIGQRYLGEDVSKMPEHYDEGFIKGVREHAQTQAQRIASQLKDAQTEIARIKAEKVPKSLQSMDVLIDDKPTKASYDPATGYYWRGDENVTARVAPVAKEATPRQAPATGSLEDYVTRTYGDKPTPSQILQARKDYGQADDRPRVNVSVGGEGALTPDAIEYTAAAYRLLGTRAIPTRISGTERAKILNEAAKQSRALGQSPATTVTRQLAVKADSGALTTLQKLQSSADGFEAKALAQADLIAGLSTKVARTRFPIVNDMIQAGREKITGDEDATKLGNAITTFAAEYAKIMEGSTGSVAGSSEGARAAAKRLINTGMSQGTLKGVLDLMKQEMRYTIQGYDVAKQHITDRMSETPVGPRANDPLGIR